MFLAIILLPLPVAQTDKIANSFFLATTILLQYPQQTLPVTYTLSISSISYKTVLTFLKLFGVETIFLLLSFLYLFQMLISYQNLIKSPYLPIL